ncbi:uncharacterized protein LOC100180481 isoform X2 [Ciona intestinalis]
MEQSSPSPSNIVATAMSTANLTPPTADSPQPSISSMKAEPSSPHITITSPATQPRSGTPVTAKVESMEVSDHHVTSHILHKQHSLDSDSQRSSPQPMNVPRFREDSHEKPVVVINDQRGEAKDTRIVMPPNTFQPTTNGETRLPPPIVLYNNERGEPMCGGIPMNILLAKEYKNEQEFEKPKEDSTYPITCGNNKGDLVWKKFVCPGINAKCVKCGDNWFTPKEFVNYAGKSTLKDWKRAIRINGIMLRKMIENGELNYYDHDNNCSNQCRSNKSSSFDNSEKYPSSFESDAPRENSLDFTHVRSSSEEQALLQAKRNVLSSISKSQESGSSLQAGGSLERSSSEDSGLAGSPHVDSMIMREAVVSVEKVHDLHSFWNGIIRMDLFDDIIRDVITQIRNLQSRTKHVGSLSLEDAATMSNLVNSLEMIPSIVRNMSHHKEAVEKQAEESTHAIHELEKKLAEQRKYEQDLKRKSQHLDTVMSLTPNEKRKRTMLRFVRQKAVDRVPPGTRTSTPPMSQRMPENVMLSAQGGRLTQRELWPQAIQAASSQMARMNVSGAGIPPMFFTTHPTGIEGYPPSLHQFIPTSQPVPLQHPTANRDATQSPSKK